jgi:hypothetical protein
MTPEPNHNFGRVKVKNPSYLRRDAELETTQRSFERRTRRFAASPRVDEEGMSEARTPEEDTIETGDENEPGDEQYDGPDPEEDEKRDGRTKVREPDRSHRR